MERDCLLISDLDGTLLGDDRALDRFAQWREANRRTIRLVYNTGRFFDSVVDVIAHTALPEPDAIIGGVGTQIRQYPSGNELIRKWPGAFVEWNRNAIATELLRFPRLTPQPVEFQAEFKQSYFAHNLPPRDLQRISRSLAKAGHKVELVYSSSRDLDILPAGINKGSAAARLAEHWRFQPLQVLVCGDTGNDMAMFTRGFRGIVVANARKELRDMNSPHIYHAQSGHAEGVREGVEFWLAAAT